MDPIELLMNEHRQIEAGLDALDNFVDGLAPGQAEALNDLADFVRFIREFADATHHGKEEDILFELMVREGFPKEGGPIAVMLMEHDEGRGLVKQLAELVEAGEPLEGERATRASAAAHGFSGLLRAHIQKEDGILYPMAQARLTPAAFEELSHRSQAFEEENAARKQALMRLGEGLIEKYR